MRLKTLVASMALLGLASGSAFAAHGHMMTGANAAPMVPAASAWYNKIKIGGRINVDGHWGQRDIPAAGLNTKEISINNAQFNVNATVNKFTTAYVSLAYNDVSDPYSYAAPNAHNKFGVQQAYFTLVDPHSSNFHLRVGQQYMAFGDTHHLNPISRSLTTIISQTRAVAAELGFHSAGLMGRLAVFQNPMKQRDAASVVESHATTTYALGLGYKGHMSGVRYGVGAGYLDNMTAVASVENLVKANSAPDSYRTRVGAVSLHAKASSGPFMVGVKYVTATKKFDNADFSYRSSKGAKPAAFGAKVGYHFPLMGKHSMVSLGYQQSRQAAQLDMAQRRFLVNYHVELYPNTTLGLQFAHNKDYAHGYLTNATQANDATYNSLALRLGVKFG